MLTSKQSTNIVHGGMQLAGDTYQESCSIIIGHQGNTSIVELTGEIDVASAPLLTHALGSIVRAKTGHIVLDTQRLTYIDSIGMQTLLSACQELKSKNRKLVIAGCHGILMKLLSINNLDKRFTFYTSVEDALIGLNEK